MLENLKKEVCSANLLLPKYGLVIFTWGNVSAFDCETGYVVIKPSGVDYDKMTFNDMVVVDLDGNIIEGELNPSSDVLTHLELYKNFDGIRGVVHTHSSWATVFAQAGKGIKPYGTTHSDYFYGEIPCTRDMTDEEIKKDYELNTGKVIVETFKSRYIEPEKVPAVLVKNHAPFTWGKNAFDAVHNSVVLENIAMMAYKTETLTGFNIKEIDTALLDKHYLRKHGKDAYYGQKNK